MTKEWMEAIVVVAVVVVVVVAVWNASVFSDRLYLFVFIQTKHGSFRCLIVLTSKLSTKQTNSLSLYLSCSRPRSLYLSTNSCVVLSPSLSLPRLVNHVFLVGVQRKLAMKTSNSSNNDHHNHWHDKYRYVIRWQETTFTPCENITIHVVVSQYTCSYSFYLFEQP